MSEGGAYAALAALVLQLGGTPDQADAVAGELANHPMARKPSGLIKQVQGALDLVKLRELESNELF